MPPMDLRPMSLGELLDRTFSLYRNHFLLFVGIMMVPYLFMLALQLANQALQSVAAAGPSTAQDALVALSASAVVFIGFAGFLLTYGIAQAATVFAVSNIHMGRPATVRDSFAQVRGRIGRVLNVTITVWIRVFGGLLLLFVPGVLLACRYAMAIPAAMLEDIRARDAIRRSIVLAEGSYGRILLIYVLFFTLTYVAWFLFEMPFGIAILVYALRGEIVSWLMTLASIGNFIGATLVGPIGAISFALLYYDERVRKEALDLQLMIQALDEAAPPLENAAPASDPGGIVVPRQLS